MVDDDTLNEARNVLNEVLNPLSWRIADLLMGHPEGLNIKELVEKTDNPRPLVSMHILELMGFDIVTEGDYEIIEYPGEDGKGKAARTYKLTTEGVELYTVLMKVMKFVF